MINRQRLPAFHALLIGDRRSRYRSIRRHLWGDVGLSDEAAPRLARIR